MTASVAVSKNKAMDTLNLSEIIQVDFPQDQFVNETTDKTQICLHHTAGGNVPTGHWIRDKRRIVTPIVVDRDGSMHQYHSSRKWGYHLGVKKKVFTSHGLPYKRLDKTCIGLEIVAWGGLKHINGEWRTYANDYGKGDRKTRNGNNVKVVIPEAEITFYPNGYRGYEAFHFYTDKQIEATRKLLEYWCERYKIPKAYHDKIWDVDKTALMGIPGIYTHTSYRKDKSDCHPQKELVAMLKGLTV